MSEDYRPWREVAGTRPISKREEEILKKYPLQALQRNQPGEGLDDRPPGVYPAPEKEVATLERLELLEQENALLWAELKRHDGDSECQLSISSLEAAIREAKEKGPPKGADLPRDTAP